MVEVGARKVPNTQVTSAKSIEVATDKEEQRNHTGASES